MNTPALCVVKCRFYDTCLGQRKRRLQAIFRAFANVLCRSLKTTLTRPCVARRIPCKHTQTNDSTEISMRRRRHACDMPKLTPAWGDSAPPTAAIRPQKFLRRFNPAFRRLSHALGTPAGKPLVCRRTPVPIESQPESAKVCMTMPFAGIICWRRDTLACHDRT